MLSLPIISLVAAFALINPVKSAAPTVDQTVEFVITSPTGLTTCLTANGNFDGAIVTVAPCGRISPFVKAWTVENGGSATGRGPVTNIRVFADKCLDVTGGVNADGTKVQVWTCAENSPNQNFNVNGDGSISWAGKGKCVDVTGGHFGDGTQLQVWTCSAGNSNQIFTSTALDPTHALVELNPIQANSIPWCLTALSGSNGARVVLQLCSGDKASLQQWQIAVSGFGSVSLFDGTKCLDVQDGVGKSLQIWDCGAGNPNQKWVTPFFGVENPVIQWAHHGKCVTATDRVDSAAIQLSDCGGVNQTWGQSPV